MTTMKYFALKDKRKLFEFICISKDQTRFHEKILMAYWNKKGISQSSAPYSMAEFLSDYDKVIVEIKEFKK